MSEHGTRATCPACTFSTSKVHSHKNGYAVMSCGSCGTAFASPRPTPEVLAETYSEAYFSAPDGSVTGYANYDFLPELNAGLQWPTLQRYLGTSMPSTPGRLLDIGCATGAFLGRAKQDGWQVHGTDFSARAAARAEEVFGVHVDSGTVVPTTHSQPFDLVTMWHVLEHLVDPAEALEQLRPLLRPGGVLFVELPNWGSLGRRRRQSEWSQLRPPEHINFFTPASLSLLLDRCGYRVLRSHSVYPTVPMSVIPLAQRPRMALKFSVGRLLGLCGAGGYVRTVATPR